MAAAAFGAEGYKVINKIKIGGTGGWDYVAVDPATQPLYASHGGIVEVVDAEAGKVVGQITQLHGVHGIAVARDLGKGFITNGQSNSVTIFDLKTLEKTGEPAVGGQNPDAICYEPKTQAHLHHERPVQRFHRHRRQDQRDHRRPSRSARSRRFCAVDGAGKLYVNLEELQRDRGDRCRQARRDAARVAGSVRRPVRPGDRREEQEAVLACAATR